MYKREEEILSAIAQSITGNHSLMVKVGNELGCTNGNVIIVGSDDVIDDFFKIPHDNFLMRLKLMVHETLHCVYTNFEYFRFYIGNKTQWKTQNLKIVENIFNMLEDMFIEAQVKYIFDGWLLDAFKYGSDIAKKNAPEIQDSSPFVEWFNACIQYRESLNAKEKELRGHFTSAKAKEIFEETIRNFSDYKGMGEPIKRCRCFYEITRMVLTLYEEDTEFPSNLNISTQTDVENSPENGCEVAFDFPEYIDTEVNNSNDDKKDICTNTSDKLDINNDIEKNIDNGKEDTNNTTNNVANNNNDSHEKIEHFISQITKEATKFSNSFTKQKGVKNYESLRNEIKNDYEQKKVAKENKDIINTLRNIFRKEIKRIKNEVIYSTSGRYDPLKATVDGHRTIEVFKSRRAEGEEKDAAILFSLDESSSMNDYELKTSAVHLVASIMESLAPFKEIKIQAEGWTEDSSITTINLYKSFDSKPNSCIFKALEERNSNTPFGFALQHANEVFAKRGEKNKVLFMITDGKPFCPRIPIYSDKVFIKKEIRTMRNQGVEPIILVIGYSKEKFSYYHNLFGNNFVPVDFKNVEWVKKVAYKLKKAAKAFD